MSETNCKDIDKKNGDEICNKYPVCAEDKKHSVDERVSGDSIVKNTQLNRKMLAQSYQASVLEAISNSPQMYNSDLDQPMPVSPESSSSASPPSYDQCVNNNNNTENITTPQYNDLYTAEISNFLQNAPESTRNQLVSGKNN